MPSNAIHSIDEYHIFFDNLDLSETTVIKHFAIPRAGYVRRWVICAQETLGGGLGLIHLRINGVRMVTGTGLSQIAMQPGLGSAAGTCYAQIFERPNARYFGGFPIDSSVYEAEEGDVVDDGLSFSVLEIENNGGGAAGIMNGVITIGRK
jgi:hypothetical protein